MIYLHLLLFLATIASTVLVGGFLYSLAIMTILLCHELGHYFVGRHYGIPSTLPFFIPLPLPPFGTFGAVIKMKGGFVNRNTLFDVGIAGPLSGFAATLPFIVVGMKMSTVTPLAGIPAASYMQLGDPLLFRLLQPLLIGDIPAGHDLVLHPFAYAGWVGLFVTSLNLLPVGQLDGGHAVYAIFGEKSTWVYRAVILGLGILAAFTNIGWLTLVILLLIFGMRHPRPFDSETELDGRRKKIAIAVLAIFILSFIPSPFPEMNLTKLIEKGF
ncbi:MAG: Peptidase family M50 [Syntrophorhabdus sp. PtaB.Bin047]|jgi:membrane-associated protease RseP (regulator of RpoE activity)|nr:MAG: Peptidase family M50 [Syntrophorhabdus sp. PtaB.Bin047]